MSLDLLEGTEPLTKSVARREWQKSSTLTILNLFKRVVDSKIVRY